MAIFASAFIAFAGAARADDHLPAMGIGEDDVLLPSGVDSDGSVAGVSEGAASADENLVSLGKWKLGAAAQPQPAVRGFSGDRIGSDGSDASDLGAYVGYRVFDDEDNNSWVDLNVKLTPDPYESGQGLYLQPGIDYKTQVTDDIRVSADLFSNFGAESILGTGRVGFGQSDSKESGSGPRDVGFGLGITYGFADNWDIATHGQITRSLGGTGLGAGGDNGKDADQFVGGIMLNYDF